MDGSKRGGEENFGGAVKGGRNGKSPGCKQDLRMNC